MSFFNLFKRKLPSKQPEQRTAIQTKQNIKKQQTHKSIRKGEIGEYKIDIQLAQLPKTCKFLSDIMVPNTKSRSGFSQIDHVILTPFGIFVIETKNYQGHIYGKRGEKKWRLNGNFDMYNPFLQNFGHIQALKNQLSDFNELPYTSMVSFTRRATFKVDPELRKIQSDELIVYDTELSEFIHRKLILLPKIGVEPCLTDEDITVIHERLKVTNITDLKVRKEHIEKAKGIKETPERYSKAASDAKCAVCGKEVSEKVKAFCLSHEKKFKGKVYCFAHQQSL